MRLWIPFHHSTIAPLHQSPGRNNTQEDVVSVTSEKRISLFMLAEGINEFNELKIQSTIHNSVEDDVESNPNINPKVDIYTSNGNFPYKLFINWLIPEIIPGAIPPIDQMIAEDAAGIRETLEARKTILSKEIVTDAACRGAQRCCAYFWNYGDVSRTDGDGTTLRDGNTAVAATRLTSPVQIFQSTTNSQSQIGNR